MDLEMQKGKYCFNIYKKGTKVCLAQFYYGLFSRHNNEEIDKDDAEACAKMFLNMMEETIRINLIGAQN